MTPTDLSRQRRARKAARGGYYAGVRRAPTLSLSESGDTVLFNGTTYHLFYAHGGLQFDPRLKADLCAKGYTGSQRVEVFDAVRKLVAESPYACNILGTGLAREAA
jgi:hypothetical protein